MKIMEILQAAMDKMGLSCKRLTTFFVVFFIALPVVLMVNSMYKNSSFGLLGGFPKVPGGRAKNVTDEFFSGGPNVTTNSLGLEGRVQNITHQNIGGREKNKTVAEVRNLLTCNTLCFRMSFSSYFLYVKLFLQPIFQTPC